ncbi:MAG: CDGSH iron-sulfur domain-containing protein [Candidatus Midichloria sp.]|nr:MAG: CDGSH iron-sulfur domain-containing protein [Candidatus Midichloria sp.]
MSNKTKLPKIATLHSIKIEIEGGKAYYWCSCGLSNSQPFCDGSHKDTGFLPIEYKTEESRIIRFCGCKYSKKGAICDGSHKLLKNFEEKYEIFK